MKKISVLGDSNVDIIITLNKSSKLSEPKLFFGGTSANVAAGLSKLGNNISFFGSVGNDIYGQDIINNMSTNSINTENLEIIDNSNTAMVIGIVSKNGERDLYVWPPKCAAHSKYVITDNHIAHLENSDWLHVSGISLREEPVKSSMLAAMKICKKNKVKISFDLNLRTELWGLTEEFKTTVFQAIKYSDFIFGNLHDEINKLFNKDNLLQQLSNFAEHDQVFITRDGANGSTTYINDKVIASKGLEVIPIDTVGAGDAFNVGFIHSMINENNLEKALLNANTVAAYTLEGESSRHQPNIEELENFTNRFR